MTQFVDLIDIFSARTQELEDQLIKLLDERAISNSAGAQLDGIGVILNTPREVGETDNAYRNRLTGVTGQLALSGEIETLITVYLALTQAASVEAIEYYPAGVMLTAVYDGDIQNPDLDQSIISAMNETKAAGVELDLRFVEEGTFLELADESETDANGNGPIDPNQGLGDEVLTEGGGLARAII